MELKVEKKVDEKAIDELVNNEEITEKKIEKSLNYEELSKEEKDAIEEFNKKIDINDAAQILQYGAAAQEKISQFSDSILEDVKTKNTGEVGDLLADLVSQIKSFDKDVSSSSKQGLLSKIFTNVYRVDAEAFSMDMIDEYQPTLVILEAGERRCERLAWEY